MQDLSWVVEICGAIVLFRYLCPEVWAWGAHQADLEAVALTDDPAGP
jgi:hypothetical protein